MDETEMRKCLNRMQTERRKALRNEERYEQVRKGVKNGKTYTQMAKELKMRPSTVSHFAAVKPGFLVVEEIMVNASKVYIYEDRGYVIHGTNRTIAIPWECSPRTKKVIECTQYVTDRGYSVALRYTGNVISGSLTPAENLYGLYRMLKKKEPDAAEDERAKH